MVKIDRFYGFLFVDLVILTGIIVFCWQTIFKSWVISNEIDQKIIGNPIKVEKEKVNQAYDLFFNQKIILLDLGL